MSIVNSGGVYSAQADYVEKIASNQAGKYFQILKFRPPRAANRKVAS